MSKYKILHNPRCTKSRNALKLLEEKNLKPEIIEYLDNPPSATKIKEVLKSGGYEAQDIIRSKEAKEEGLDIKSMSEAEKISAITKHPRIMQRPIVIKNSKAIVAREDGWFEKLK